MKCINGWTKEKMKEQIRKKNNGTVSKDLQNRFCVYETQDGNHCAVGCFIPENHPGLQCRGSVGELFFDYPDLLSVMPLPTSGLQTIQTVHDNSYTDQDVRDVLCAWIDNNVED